MRRLFKLTASLMAVSFLGLITTGPAFCEISPARLQAALDKLDQEAQKHVAEDTVPGLAIAVVHNDKVVYVKGFGVREVGKPEKVDADTVFQLASVSKPVSATVVAQLVGEGKISWDSKLSDLDPPFEMYDSWVTRQITIRDMYSHRSGLPDHAGDLLEDIGYDRAQVLHRLRYQRPDSSFRSGYAYTNFGLTEGAVAAAKPYGLTWEEAADDKLFKPLGMTSSSARYSDFMARTNHAAGHVKLDGKWVHGPQRQPDAQSPAGGVSSSVNDMSKWLRLRLDRGKFEGKQIIAEKPLVETEHPQMLTRFSPLNGLPGFYGLGMNVSYDEHGRLRLGHSGAFAMGAATVIGLVPSEKLGIVVLTNAQPIGFAEGLSETFLELALDGELKRDWIALFRKVFSDPAALGIDTSFDFSKRPSPAAPPLSNSVYVGKYSSDLYGDIAVSETNGKLSMTQGPKNMTLSMNPYDRDTFTYMTPGENSSGLTGVTFTIGPKGKATSAKIHYMDQFGQGEFTRVD